MRPLWKFSSTFLFYYSVSSLCLSRTYSLSLICIHIQVSMDITLWHCRQTVDKFQAPHWNTNPLSWNAIRNVLQSQNIFEYYCLRDYNERTGHNGIYIYVCRFTVTHIRLITPMHVEWPLYIAISSQFFVLLYHYCSPSTIDECVSYVSLCAHTTQRRFWPMRALHIAVLPRRSKQQQSSRSQSHLQFKCACACTLDSHNFH